MWRAHNVSGLSRDTASGAPTVEIRFERAAPPFHGIYEDELGVVYVNSTLDDPEQRAIAIAHELGHAFGLWHVSADERSSVMNPGNLSVSPTSADGMALVEIWGACDEIDRK